jgi:hypothetical protein
MTVYLYKKKYLSKNSIEDWYIQEVEHKEIDLGGGYRTLRSRQRSENQRYCPGRAFNPLIDRIVVGRNIFL